MDTGVNEVATIPTGSPSRSAQMAATPVGYRPYSLRSLDASWAASVERIWVSAFMFIFLSESRAVCFGTLVHRAKRLCPAADVVHDQTGDRVETGTTDRSVGSDGVTEDPVGRNGFQAIGKQTCDKRIVGMDLVSGDQLVGAHPFRVQHEHDRRLGDIGVPADAAPVAGGLRGRTPSIENR